MLVLCTPVAAQETGWHYSPLPGEGDRATLGCALGSTPEAYACIAVRCEDDFTTGVHIHTSRASGDAGRWAITIDKETRAFDAEAAGPYGARLIGDFSWVLDNLANGAVAYLAPEDGSDLPANHIPLDGSLYAINAALAFCAPRTPAFDSPPPARPQGSTTETLRPARFHMR
ncbi:hypothetical protein [Devosia sp. Root635]|uniref:hypothetical protein n=1 Tax=Devosia sp. Root635 TaxID=1736575 RepID=UPI0006FEFBF4|nr:hypothetical protein [Devosia sp. Root635]KRA43144.1 hypothetical protein ASD80_07765 [Devosia sp. Root635]